MGAPRCHCSTAVHEEANRAADEAARQIGAIGRHGRRAYKVKLVASGYRLIYQVIDDELIVLVIAIGKREANEAYRKAHTRLT